MNILSELKTRNLGLLELLSIGFDIYLKEIKIFVILFLITAFPFQIIFYAYSHLSASGIIPSGINAIISFATLFLLSAASYVYFIGLAVATENFIYGNNKNVIKMISSRTLPLIGLNIRYYLNVYLRSLLFIVPGVIYAVNNLYFGFAYILRDQRGKAAFAYSRSILTKNHSGQWRVFFFGLLTSLVVFCSQVVFSKILNAVPFMSSLVVNSILSQALASIVSVGASIASILLFFNLDLRKGLDREVAE